MRARGMRRVLAWLLACGIVLPAWPEGAAPAPRDFSWRATLELTPGANAARVQLPAQALLHLRSPDARDLRVFDAQGTAVPFAIHAVAPTPADAQERSSREYPVHSLQSPGPGSAADAGAVQVRVDTPDGQRQVWVRMGSSGSPAATTTAPGSALPSVIVDLREDALAWRAIRVQADLPAGVLVPLQAATSSDLSNWTPLALQGRLYRFEALPGQADSGLRNDLLTIEGGAWQPRGRFLRLSWYGHEGVQVRSLRGVEAVPAPRAARVTATLPAGRAVDERTLEWSLPFAARIAALDLESVRDNGFVPVLVQTRTDPALPWRNLATAAVYRLGQPPALSRNPPLPLNGTPLRHLRVQATHGFKLDPAAVQASLEFEPVEIVFLAAGPGPLRIGVGRADTPRADLGLALLNTLTQGRDIAALPLARVTAVEATTLSSDTGFLGGIDRRWVLWGALLGGIVLLGFVLVRLLRQMRGADGGPPKAG